MTFVATRIVRRSNRSTITPAGAESRIAGARKARKSRLTAVLLAPLPANTMSVNAYNAMFAATSEPICALQSAMNRRLRATAAKPALPAAGVPIAATAPVRSMART